MWFLVFCLVGYADRISAQQHNTLFNDTVYVKDTRIPAAIGSSSEEAIILTPKQGPAPQINGPKVYGCKQENPFIYRIPVTGERPILFSAKGLPKGLHLDTKSGIITGNVKHKGKYVVVLKANNHAGKDTKTLEIICGDQLNLTPPMGWNSWYAHYGRITDKMMREAADYLVSSGMADVGYQYVNIDDCWANKQEDSDNGRVGPPRDTGGNIMPNSYFPDMKGMTDYIHAKGLKAGIYSSPGVTTCAGFTGSFGYESRDAKQFADWGFDFLKYDYCSYEYLEKRIKATLPGITAKQLMQEPYFNMGNILKSLKRDISFNLCQYGRDEVWEWGAEAGSSWRTGADLGTELNRLFEVALENAKHGKWVKPGAWNDPDYIQIGYVGDTNGMGLPILTKLSPTEQYAFMSLWSLLAAPLIYSGDLTKLNDFTLNVLCNTAVIAIDQDPLGKCATVIERTADTFIMVKELEDGSRAIGLCNKGTTPAMVTINRQETGMEQEGLQVHDVWRQQDVGVFKQQYTAAVPARGVVLIKVSYANRGK